MNHVIFNGKFFESTTPVIGPDNRGLRYGDGLFETIKYKNGELILADEHLARLWNGLKSLRFDLPRLFTPDLLEDQILQLIQKNKQVCARVRLSVIRGNGGLYDAPNHHPNYLVQSWPLAENNGLLNENGLQLCIYRDALKSTDKFSNIKHNNYLPYFMAALFAKEQRCNDAVVLNQHQHICDSTIANIFLIKNNQLFTPALTEGCVAGVMRHFIIRELKKHGYTITETAITEQDLLDADEVFLTNSIYNMRWVAGIHNSTYQNTMIKDIHQLLSKTNEPVFC